MQILADEATRQAQLDSMKRRATLLLVAAMVLYFVTRALEARYHWLGIIRATAEAAMVGGLADWFAVTAIFRHPLGIPIPHTAIVPAKKDRVGRTLRRVRAAEFPEPRGDRDSPPRHSRRTTACRVARTARQRAHNLAECCVGHELRRADAAR